MSTLGDRIKEAREKQGLYQAQLAELVGAKSAAVISNWEKGINKPDADKIVQLCKALHVSASYLLDYNGESALALRSSEIDHIKKYRALDEYGRETVNIILNRELARLTEKKVVSEMPIPNKTIPFRCSIQPASAGTGAYLGPEEFETIFVADNPLTRRAAFGVPVSGDSMEPAYHNGDVLVVEKAEDIAPGEIGVFSIDGEGYVKQRGENELISLNPDYEPILMNHSIRCHGRVIGVLDPSWILE